MKTAVRSLAAMCLAGALGAGAETEGKRPLSQVFLDGIEFQDASLESVLDYLRVKAKAENGSPSNFILYDPAGTIAEADPRISMRLRRIPLSEVVRYSCRLSGTDVLVDKQAILVGLPAELADLKQLRRKSPSRRGRNAQLNHLASVSVPRIDLQEADFSSVIDYLRRKANDPADPPPRPVNLWIKNPGGEADPGTRVLTLKLEDTDLLTVLRYACELAGCDIRPDRAAIAIGEPDSLALMPTSRAKPGSPLFRRLDSARIDSVEFSETSLGDALAFVRFHTRDARFPDGVNLIVETETDRTIDLSLAGISALSLLHYVNEATGSRFRVEENAIVVHDEPVPKKSKTRSAGGEKKEKTGPVPGPF